MNRSLWRVCLLSLTFLLALGCAQETGTQVIVHFAADDASEMRATQVRVTVFRPGAAPEIQTEDLAGAVSLPFVQPLHPGVSTDGRFHVLGELLDREGNAFVVERSMGRFVGGQRLHVFLHFTGACHDRTCGGTESCVLGSCVPACVRAELSDASDVRTPPVSCGDDAGMADAGRDVGLDRGVIDVGPEDSNARDGGLDNGLDAGTGWDIEDWPWDWPCDPDGCAAEGVIFHSIGNRAGDVMNEESGASVDAAAPTHVMFGPALPEDVGTGDAVFFAGSDVPHFVLARVDAHRLRLQSEVDPAVEGVIEDAPFIVRRSYRTLTDWEQSHDEDLSAMRLTQVGVCYADAPFVERVVIEGATTDAAHYRMLTAAPGHRHHGNINGGIVVRPDDGMAGHAIRVRDRYTRLQWLEITGWAPIAANSPQFPAGIGVEAEGVQIDTVLIHEEGYSGDGNNNAAGIMLSVSGVTLIVRNSIVSRVGGPGILTERPAGGSRLLVDNTTLTECRIHEFSPWYGCIGNFDAPGVVLRMRNVVGVLAKPGPGNPRGECNGGTGRGEGRERELQWGDFFLSGRIDPSTTGDARCAEELTRAGRFNVESDHNLSSDGTAPGENSILHAENVLTVESAHLSPSSPAIGQGMALDDPALARDIDEQLRPTDRPWDIGADQRAPL